MRTPKIMNAIIETFEEASRKNQPLLSFSEVWGTVIEKLGCKVTKGSLSNSLAALLERGIVKKELVNNRVAYRLTKQYEKQVLKDVILRHIQNTPVTDLEAEFEDIPLAVFCSPLEEASFLQNLGFLDWSMPSRGIASIIFYDLEKLPEFTKKGITKLLFWCYWAKVKSESTLSAYLNGETRTQEALKKAEKEGDEKRIQLEKTILEILNITKKLLESKNLYDFITLAEESEEIVLQHERRILKMVGHWVNRGEQLFHYLVRKPGERIYSHLPLDEKVDGWRLLESSVFNEFCLAVISRFKNEAREIEGDYNHAVKQIEAYKVFLKDLLTLFKQHRFMLIYLWNVPISSAEEKYVKLPEFQNWLEALRNGELDYSLFFIKNSIKLVEKAYKRVKRSQPPSPDYIDMRGTWTLKDIYELHPRGKDEKFWLELLDLLRSLAQTLEQKGTQKEDELIKKTLENHP